jgi:hypothetical protein
VHIGTKHEGGLTIPLSAEVNTRPNRLLISPVPGITEMAEPTMLVMFEEEKPPPLCVLMEEGPRFGDGGNVVVLMLNCE